MASVSAPTSPTDSRSDIYGPDRHQNYQQPPPQSLPQPERAYRQRPSSQLSSSTAPAVRFDEAQLAIMASQNTGPTSGLKDALAIAASRVTPGVDDTPYLMYAIEALTRRRNPNSDDDVSDAGDYENDRAGFQPPPSRRLQDEEMGYAPASVPLPPTTYTGSKEPRRRSNENAPAAHPVEIPIPQPRAPKQKEDFLVIRPTPPLAPLSQAQPDVMAEHATPGAIPHTDGPNRRSNNEGQDDSDRWVPVTKVMRENYYPNDKAYPPLTYKPRMLRPFSMMILMTMCILMIAGLILSAVYSDSHTGLTDYPGSIYNGQYFLFRLLPQLLAAVILVYAQAMQATSMRILPFTSMASEDARQRYLALFQRLYPSTFLWPRLSGPWQMKFFSVATWLMLFTIPLQSAAFTCIFGERGWIWASVQGVVWALVVLYAILTSATAILMVFWFGKWTGLVWDIRSIADLVPLLNRSNTTHSYRGKEFSEAGRGFKNQLRDRWFDRLGYWRTEDMQTGGIWYSVGTSGAPSHADQDPRIMRQILGDRDNRPTSRTDASLASHDLAVPTNLTHEQHRYLPWCLRSIFVVLFAVLASVLLLILLVVSFLPQTRLEAGFQPLLSAKPGGAAFSAANFLYSFLPSLLGMLLFLAFQSLDLALRVVQPWGELSRSDGSVARKSILADYASCLPFQVSWRAARLGHWRVSVISLMSTLFLAIPILAGGLFMALTRNSDGQVRMYPSIPVYGVLLAFLFLYLGCLTLLLPRRAQFRLPHAVTSLAEIISFCSADELTQDAAFRAVRSNSDVQARLGADDAADPREESVWFFGVLPGKDEKRLSVRRMRRFTEKLTLKRSSMRSMV